MQLKAGRLGSLLSKPLTELPGLGVSGQGSENIVTVEEASTGTETVRTLEVPGQQTQLGTESDK